MPETTIGLLGYGTVGSAVHRLLSDSAGSIERVTGGDHEGRATATRRRTRPRGERRG